MTRLTNALKQEIIGKAIAGSPLTKQLKALKEKTKNCLIAIHTHHFGGAENLKKLAIYQKAILKLQDKLPETIRDHVSIGTSMTCNISVYVGGYNMRISSKVDHPVINIYNENINRKSKPFKALLENCKQVEILDKNISHLEGEIKTILDSVTTVAKLLKVWAEAESIIPSIETTGNLPSIVLGDINKKLGIPKS